MSRVTNTLVFVIAGAVASTLVTATAVIAASKHRTGLVAHAVNEQTILWRTGKNNRAHTASTKWTDVPMPSGGCVVGQDTCSSVQPTQFMVWAKGPISLTFSGTFTRAPVELRFRDGVRLMRPGAVNFRPGAGANAFSFSFVSPRRSERICEGPVMEWRSPTGAEVRLNKATIVVHYKTFTPEQPVGCQ